MATVQNTIRVNWKKAVADMDCYIDMIEAFMVAEGEEHESNGDIPEWIWSLHDEVIEFARKAGNPQWVAQIEEQERLAASDS